MFGRVALLLAIARAAFATESFDRYMAKYNKTYVVGSAEYHKRKALYEQRSAFAHLHNSNPDRRWNAGINVLSDWSESELSQLRGYVSSVRPERSGAGRRAGGDPALLQSGEEHQTMKVSLPAEKSWTDLESLKHIRNQGGCGSCWAIAASTVLEAHAEIYTGKRRTFSVQQIVSCTPNPRACGGTGQCQGATTELAMDWVLNNGCAEEKDVPYKAVDGTCTVGENAMIFHSSPPSFLQKQRQQFGPSAAAASFGMRGWEMLPKNTEAPLVRALAEQGPVAISVAASGWSNYDSGVFDGCSKDAIIDHAVVLVGYGKEHWLVQNSWSVDWGENGRIRLLRHADPSSWCGMDNKPQEGTACRGEDEPVPVCGMCGIFFDSVVVHFA